MPVLTRGLVALGVLALLACPMRIRAQSSAPDPAGAEFFEKKIRPVLTAHCYPCHSSQAAKLQGGFLLDNQEGLRKGGNSGPAIVPGDADRSLLIQAIRYTDQTLQMPPGKALDAATVADFEQWIRMGAPDPRTAAPSSSRNAAADKTREFWSFQKPSRQAVPLAGDPKWVRRPVDNFILAKLAEARLTPSPPADRRTLLRRATYDLIGLPPSPKEMDDFLADSSPNAFEKAVDRLLASPRYGERWGRHWLDVARYADTSDGQERFAFSYTYRDWVIRAFNQDMPYDQFVKKQVAADQMGLADRRDLAALGFITLGRSVPKGENDMIDDRIDVIARGLLGMTVTCARCHDHKFDPIPTRDYYSLYGIIANSLEPVEYPLVAKEDPNSDLVRRYREGMARRLKAIDDFKTRRHAELVAEFRQPSWIARYLLGARKASKMGNTETEKLSRDGDFNLFVLRRWRDYLNRTRENGDGVFAAWNELARLPADGFAAKAAEALLGLPPTANTEVVKAFAEKPPSSLEDAARTYGELLAKFDSASPRSEPAAEALRLALRGDGSPTNIPLADFMKIRGPGGDDNIIRGLTDAVRIWEAQYAFRGLAPRAMALEDSPHPVAAHVFVRGNPNDLGVETPPHFLTVLSAAPQPFTQGTGRLELANAISCRDNPLTARVIVNRVWAWHFGRGIVGTPSDFGTRGDLPTHPELLDYLATRFMEEGWSIKKLHKWIMLSSAYQQSSADRPDARQADPENKLLWRMNRQRLDYESLRDSALFVAGQLDVTMGGLPFSLTASPAVPRRTVYAYIPRGRLPGELNAFDFASPDSHVPQRFLTTVPQQALYLMNSPFIAEEAKHLMARREIDAAPDDSARVKALYRLVYGRSPSPEEMQAALDYVRTERASTDRKMGPERAPVWQYGMAAFDEKPGIRDFQAFRYFSDQKWQPASILPQPSLGNAGLSAKGGAPPDDAGHVVVRRWVSRVAGTVEITGTVGHKLDEKSWGDGVRALIFRNGTEKLAEAVVRKKKSPLAVNEVRVEPGDTIDFVTDCMAGAENDDFTWSPVIQLKQAAKTQVWNAEKDFRGPAPATLSPWEKYAQVLLETNEFAFVD